jgi:hypothetical protein
MGCIGHGPASKEGRHRLLAAPHEKCRYSVSRLLAVEEVVVRLDVLGQVPQGEDLAVTKSEDVHLVHRDRRAVGTAGHLVEDHGGVVVVGVCL